MPIPTQNAGYLPSAKSTLNQLIIVNERHLSFVLPEYVSYYNRRHPYQGKGQRFPESSFESLHTKMVYRRAVLGGLITDYARNVA